MSLRVYVCVRVCCAHASVCFIQAMEAMWSVEALVKAILDPKPGKPKALAPSLKISDDNANASVFTDKTISVATEPAELKKMKPLVLQVQSRDQRMRPVCVMVHAHVRTALTDWQLRVAFATFVSRM